MSTETVETVFDAAASTYDRARRQLIPCFDEFYGTVLELLPQDVSAPRRLLDLGAGTGLLSLLLARQFPQAQLTLLDLSDSMLAKARERLAGLAGRCDFIVADYTQALPGEFEGVVSALSIHHLEDAHKLALFHRIHQALTVGGVFINADQVAGDSPEIERLYRETWLRQVRARGVSTADLDAALVRMREDRMATLEFQLNGLRAAGFEAVHAWYQHFSFVVYSGRKGAPLPAA